MKKLLVALLTVAGMIFVLTRLADLQSMGAVIQRGNYLYLGLALLVQLGWIYNLGAFYQAVYAALGMPERRLHLARLASAAFFLAIVAPSGGLSGITVFIADARHTGRSAARVTVAGALYVWFEYIGTLALTSLGLAQLAHLNRLQWPEITASLVLLAGAFGMGALLYLGMKSADALGKALAWLAGVANAVLRPFIRRDYLNKNRAHTFSQEIAEGLSVLRQNPRWIIRPLLLVLLNKALLLTVMLLCFMAFKVQSGLGTVVAGMGLAHMFIILSPTPAGVGIAEGILAVALKSLGLNGEDAVVVTLAYHCFSFWLPFTAGMISLRTMTHSRKPAIAPTDADEPAAYRIEREQAQP